MNHCDVNTRNGTALSAAPVYMDASRPAAERAADLLSRMDLDEMLEQMAQNDIGFAYADIRISAGENAEKFRTMQSGLRARNRLGIPALTGAEALHGLMLKGATIYPQAIALGSTWNIGLVKEMASQTAKEAAAAGITQVLAPVLDLGRDPRYGRIEECFGECPYLVSRMGLAYISGLQGDNAHERLAPDKVYATLKHFAGYSIPANGINISPALIGENELRTHHLIPFEAAVREMHVMSVMPSYNSVDGMPSHASRWLLNDVLRGEWGFQGYVYSDWGGIHFLTGHRIASDRPEAGLLAVRAGVDLEAPSPQCFSSLKEHVRLGHLDAAEIEQAAARIVRVKFAAGLFDGRGAGDPPDTTVIRCPEHVATARLIAEESIILLKNEHGLLPLDDGKIRSIAVIGPNAAQCQFGDYSWSKANRDGIHFLKAVQERYEGKIQINYAKGCDLTGLSKEGFSHAVQAAQSSDVAIVVIGDTSMISTGVGWEDTALPVTGTVGEGFDVNDPVPPGVQDDLVQAVAAAGKPTIVVLLNGRPYCIPWMRDHIPAIVEAFYPGEQQGHAIADVIFGRINPSGRLPVTIARSAGHIPCTYDYKGYGRGYYHRPGSRENMGRDYVFDTPEPLWPFGFGLSYTTFRYSRLVLGTASIRKDGGILKLSFVVENTGNRPGKVVPQVYWRLLKGFFAPPEKRLLRFTKAALQPGESMTIRHEIPAAEFRQLNLAGKWVVAPAEIEIQVGDNAESIMMKDNFSITQ